MDMNELFSEKLMRHTQNYISQLGIRTVENYIGKWDTKQDDGFTVNLDVFGDMRGSFMFNIETSLAYSLVSHYILEAVDNAEIPNYADKVIAEIANIVAGKTLSEEEDMDLYLGCPAVYLNSEARVETVIDGEYVQGALTEAGIIQCLFIKE